MVEFMLLVSQELVNMMQMVIVVMLRSGMTAHLIHMDDSTMMNVPRVSV